ncbi:MAG: DNA double-strand break repair Rad50 ATPase [Caudoviricetes sp.]|nr:MAG: DNA double-strand break repair Rad50 ATPase [Caudoviricetes sp.]
MDKFKELLESSVINDDTRAILSNAWNTKLEETKAELRESVEASVRDEFRIKYENDKNRLYEAMDSMLNDAISNYSKEMIEESVKLKKQNKDVAEAIANQRKEEKKKIEENMEVFEKIISEGLESQLSLIAEEKKNLEKEKVSLAKKDARTKTAKKEKVKEDITKLNNFVISKLSEELKKVKEKEKSLEDEKEKIKEEARKKSIEASSLMAERIQSLEKFILEQLKEEITEYKEEKDSLAKLRVKMVKESKEHLNTVRKEFVERSAGLIEQHISERLEKEISELKESIREARENQFGKAIFEQFRNTFQRSFFAEGTQVRKIEKELEAVKNELTEAKKEASNIKKLQESAEIRLKNSEDRILRGKIMEKLLRPLNKDKRDVMEGLLTTVKTGELEKSFYKYLTVLNEEKTPRVNTKVLTENKNKRVNAVSVDGNRTTILESVDSEQKTKEDEDREQIRRLAGIRN